MSLYTVFQAWTDAATPFRSAAQTMVKMHESMGVFGELPMVRNYFAMLDVVGNAQVTHTRPSFAIDHVVVGNRVLSVREEITIALPFGNLLHFAKDEVDTPQPKMLVVAPLSGHFATLLRETVQVLLRDHDVYITDWANARDVPLSAGRFGIEDYIDYTIRFLEEIGPRQHVLAVCQPCVTTLATVAIMAEAQNPAQPATMTLMGGPIDTRISPTVVNDLATANPIEWFAEKLISPVPARYAGAGRKVYPGFLQLTAFMSMNKDRHTSQHRRLYRLLAEGKVEEAAVIQDFYEEYFAVLDLAAEFYLETVEQVFQKTLLAKGEFAYRGRLVDPGQIKQTALLTVEGERDDICSVGQTAAAHDLCLGLVPHMKRHHLQPGVGHYGLFAGRKWENQVYPQIRNLVLAVS
ncbi:polyhydroxyalkanoate depolymerase [Sphingomonas sp.]|uniref:polyhydroxyalkanoate depolymerase n=1 Tax=Sphingomonas sp. TaxID=28214 RepID=UPI0025E8BA22|nr:polyhydroxyalkanoate depolymerase [Sphingomonas sp.]